MTKQDKETVRQEARARRASIPGPLRLKAAEALVSFVETALTRFDLFPGATIGCYLAIGTEINTSPILRALSRQGFKLALPRTMNPSSPLEFVPWALNDPLQQDILGFPTPIGDATVIPDALIVPLVGFDRAGGRIGQGSGLYDRTIGKLRRHRPGMPMIGVCFACQELPLLPLEPHDQLLNMVVTERGLVEIAENTAKIVDWPAVQL